MNLGELRALFRSTTQDVVAPFLWSDEEINDYANDAEIEACRRAHLLIDSSNDPAQASVSAADPMVDLDYRVLYVRRARLASSSVPLKIRSARTMDETCAGWETAQAARSSVLIPDFETGRLRLYPAPSTDDTLLMTVTRLPLKALALDEDTPEINARLHRSLLYWMLFRAYSKVDADTADPNKAKLSEAAFTAEFGEKSRAIDENWALEQYYDIGEFN
jgi:hypothetical protein